MVILPIAITIIPGSAMSEHKSMNQLFQCTISSSPRRANSATTFIPRQEIQTDRLLQYVRSRLASFKSGATKLEFCPAMFLDWRNELS